MADINVERKRRSPWALIIGLLLLLALLWLLFQFLGNDQDDADDDVVTDTVGMLIAP